MKKITNTIKLLFTSAALIFGAFYSSAQIQLTQTVTGGTFPGEVGWELINTGNGIVYACGTPGGSAPSTNTYNVPAGNYEVRGYDSFGDGWNGANVTYSVSGAQVAGPFTLASGGFSNTCPGNSFGPIIGSFTLAVPCVYEVQDIVVFNDPGTCGAIVDYEIGLGSCPGPPDVNIPSGSFFPIGTTTVNVGSGLAATSFTVTVNLQLVCPSDIVIDLDPGLCEKVVTYTVDGLDCEGDPEPFTLSQHALTATVNDALDCFLQPSRHYRAYEALDQDFTVLSVTVGSYFAGSQSVQIYAYNGPMGGATLDETQFVPIGNATGFIPVAGALGKYTLNFPEPVFIPAGTQFVVEQSKLATNGLFVIAGTYAPATGLSYFTCTLGNTPQSYASLGFGFINLIQELNGLVAPPPLDIQLVEGLPSGGSFPIGCTTNTWVLFDNGEEISSCSFEICVNEYSGPVNPNLSCNNLINVSLGFVNGECRTVLGADDILEGGPYRCYENYIVQITYPQIPGINSYAEGNILDYSHVGLTLTVMVTDPVTGNRCWGQIRVEDKQAPLLDCGDELTFPCTSGYAENRDPRGNRIVFPSGLFWGSPANSPIRVTPQLFLNDAINNRRFLVEAGVIDCSQVVLTYSDQEILLGCSGEGGIWRRVIRTWVATDAYHNTSTCQQILNFERLTLQQAIAESGVTAGILNLQPCTPGFALPDYNLQGACNVWAGIKSELQMPLCGNSTHSYKLFRTYKFFDDCTGQSQDVEQIIVVKDEIAPVFTACQNGLLPQRTLNTNTFSCKADVVLTLPAVTDNCSSALTVVPSVAGAQLLNIGGTWTATFDVGGPYQVTWTATDECGNQSQCIERIFVEDKRPPVAVCITNTTVTLTEGGEARVYATSIDNGSWDNCGIFDYKVMRMSNTTRSFCGQSHNTSENPALGSTFNPAQPNAPYWRDFVSFCCADLEATEPIMVVLRVRDIYGNVNYCMVNVEVQTKIPPVITAPAAVTIECRDFQSELEFQADLLNRDRSLAKGYGWATVSSICNEEPRVSVSINLTDCGVTQFPGNRVVRRFTVGTGVNTRTADQEFFVVNSTPFRILSTPTIHNSIDDVVWPIDLELPTCNDAFDVEALKVRYNETTKTFFDFSEPALATRPRSMPFLRPVACSTPGMGHEDHVFELEGGCLKIVREWKVIDWCQANTLQNPWTYTQVIKVMDSAPAEFVSVSINLTSGQSQTVNGCPTGLISLAHTADNCAPGLSFSLVTSDDCAKLQKIAYGYRLIVGNNANSFVPTATQLTGSGLATAEGVIGWNFGAFAPQFQGVVHRMIWTLDDKCGNISTCQFDFIIRDGKKPSPICTDEIIAVLMPSSGNIAVSASLFNIASFDNCAGDLRYTFNAPFGSAGAQTTRVFDCDDYVDNFDSATGTSVVTLPIFVTDAAGNSDFCTVRLALQDNDEVCGDISSVIVRGTLATEHATGINSADVTTVVGNQANITVTSDFEGEYNLRTDRAQGSTDYVVSPEKTDHVLNGVTTLDIVLIQQHMLGVRELTSPYARIAADVNADGRINSLDIVELRQMVLLKRTSFSGSNAGLSWKFVDANYVFTTSTPEGENYATTVTIDGSKNNYGVDFVGVKLGDVNGSADAKSLGITEDRSGRALMGLEVADVELTAGMEYAIAFRSSEMSDVMGYQYALSYGKGLEVKGIEGMGQVVSENNYGIFADKNLVTMSWNGQTTGEDLFVVHVKATETVKLSNALSLSMNPAHPVAEAYTVGGEVKGLELRFNGVSTSVLGYALNQNEPNPFKTETKISFQLPSEMRAKVSISDVSGRVLRTYEGVYPAGLNELFVKRSEVGAAGVLYYTLETEDYRATKKMIVIE
jgi:hypothetical protein